MKYVDEFVLFKFLSNLLLAYTKFVYFYYYCLLIMDTLVQKYKKIYIYIYNIIQVI